MTSAADFYHPDWNLCPVIPSEVRVVEDRGLLIQPLMNLKLEEEKTEDQNSESQSQGVCKSGSQQSLQKPEGEKSAETQKPVETQKPAETKKPAEAGQKSGNQNLPYDKFQDFWGYTYVVREKFVLTWTINDLNKQIKEKCITAGEALVSAPYYIPNADNPHVIATLHCYPKGHSEKYENKIGLFFHLRATQLEDLFIPLEFSIIPDTSDNMLKFEKTINRVSPQRLKFDLNEPRSKPKKSWGCADLISLDTLLNESDIYMPNGNLDIEVSGAIRGQYNRSGTAGERGSTEDFLRDIAKLRNPVNIPGAEFDIKLQTTDKKDFYAHKVILATASDTLQILFTEGGKEVTEFIIGDYSPEVIQVFIYYAYENQTLPNLGSFGKLQKIIVLSELIQLSKTYNINRLFGLCHLELTKEVGPDVSNDVITVLQGKKSRLEVKQSVTSWFQKKYFPTPKDQFLDYTDDDLYQ